MDPRVLAVVAQPVGTGGPACGLPRPPPPISSPQVTPRPPRRGRPARRLRSKHGVAGRSVMFELGLTEVNASLGRNKLVALVQKCQEIVFMLDLIWRRMEIVLKASVFTKRLHKNMTLVLF